MEQTSKKDVSRNKRAGKRWQAKIAVRTLAERQVIHGHMAIVV